MADILVRPAPPAGVARLPLPDLNVALQVRTLLDLNAALRLPAHLDVNAALHLPALLDLDAALHLPALLDLNAALHLPALLDVNVAVHLAAAPRLTVGLHLPALPGRGTPPRMPAPLPAWGSAGHTVPPAVPPAAGPAAAAAASAAAPATPRRAGGVVRCRGGTGCGPHATAPVADAGTRGDRTRPGSAAGRTPRPELPSRPTPHGTSERAAGGAAGGAPAVGALPSSWRPGPAAASVPPAEATAARGRTVVYAGPPS
ncbi:hypothetical protein ACFOHP_20320 [Couchioplanes caeruleus subsp. azureus]|uniref:hypothetical protein n=1 Tax=Couchioplanes caeruleus TaxID=56438 RepID=UPI00360C465C